MSAGSTPFPKEFGRRLLEYEAASRKAADLDDDSAAFGVCDKLRARLGPFMGVAGYTALLRRALALAAMEVPWLRALQISADGSLRGLDEQETLLAAPSAAAEGEVVLVGHLLGLLVLFIGPALTLQMLHDVWPKWAFVIAEEKEVL